MPPLRKKTATPNTTTRHPDYDESAQRMWDDNTPDFLEAMNKGYLDDHLRDIVRAAYRRREALTGKVYVVSASDAKALNDALSGTPKGLVIPEPEEVTLATPDTELTVSGLTQAANPSSIATRIVRNLEVAASNVVGVSSRDVKHNIQIGTLWYDLSCYVGMNVQYGRYSTDKGTKDGLYSGIFRVVKIDRSTTEVYVARLPTRVRANSPAVTARQRGVTIRVPNEALFWDHLTR